MVSIPAHLCAGYTVKLSRSQAQGLGGWSGSPPAATVYWTGNAYVSLSLGSQDRSRGSAEERGVVLLHLDPAPDDGVEPAPTDVIVINDVSCEVLAVRPPNSLIAYWKLEVRTGMS